MVAAMLAMSVGCGDTNESGSVGDTNAEDAGGHDTGGENGEPDADEDDAGAGEDTGNAEDAGEPDAEGNADTGNGSDADADDTGEVVEHPKVRGRLESNGSMRCGQLTSWNAPDGVLLRAPLNQCGEDLQALADTFKMNLDEVQARGQTAIIAFHQGLELPPSWLEECETHHIDDGRFSGDTCLPWDSTYLTNLQEALEFLSVEFGDHPAISAVYFTISTMTNGAEFHWRTDKADYPYPGDEVFYGAYFDVMDLFHANFDHPIVFEAGHCVWKDEPDCQLPLELYRYSKTNYGVSGSAISMWNCAERFWAGEVSADYDLGALLQEASDDGASIGCQTVGSFSNGACRFTSDDVGNYGTTVGREGDNCVQGDDFDPEQACVDTLSWLLGEGQNETSPTLTGSWVEGWSADYRDGGVFAASEACIEKLSALSAE